jgi:hypothetical protein
LRSKKNLNRWRGSTQAAFFLAGLSLAFALILLDSHRLAADHADALQHAHVLARGASLTDPALFIEARYARHASQADRHAAFQDHPMALERFPAGSLMPPPR